MNCDLNWPIKCQHWPLIHDFTGLSHQMMAFDGNRKKARNPCQKDLFNTHSPVDERSIEDGGPMGVVLDRFSRRFDCHKDREEEQRDGEFVFEKGRETALKKERRCKKTQCRFYAKNRFPSVRKQNWCLSRRSAWTCPSTDSRKIGAKRIRHVRRNRQMGSTSGRQNLVTLHVQKNKNRRTSS